MDVSVYFKSGQRRLLTAMKASVLGDGLLVRARSTSLALLGLTAAVGLAMVAMVLNQGWPLIAGAPIPGFGGGHQAVGDATIAAGAKVANGRGAALQSGAGRQSSNAFAHSVRKGLGGTPAVAGSKPPESEAIVVSHSTPAGSPGGAAPSPAPVAQPPAPAPAPEPQPQPASAPVASSPQPSSPASQPTPETASPSQPAFVSDESGEHDHGHHYGRGASRGYGHSRSRDDSDPPESTDEPESAPSPPVAPPTNSDPPEEPESQSHAPSWSHGGGHGYGHDHGHW